MPSRRQQVGALGERYARAHLHARGYEIVATNFRTRSSELDLVCRHGRTLVFCEVRTLVAPATLERAIESVDRRKQLRVRKAARAWLQENRELLASMRPRTLRFDTVAVLLDRDLRLDKLEHVEAAW